jgi:hypothetical protein
MYSVFTNSVLHGPQQKIIMSGRTKKTLTD